MFNEILLVVGVAIFMVVTPLIALDTIVRWITLDKGSLFTTAGSLYAIGLEFFALYVVGLTYG